MEGEKIAFQDFFNEKDQNYFTKTEAAETFKCVPCDKPFGLILWIQNSRVRCSFYLTMNKGKFSFRIDDYYVKTSLKLELASSSTRIQFYSGSKTIQNCRERNGRQKNSLNHFSFSLFCFQINFYVNADIKNDISEQGSFLFAFKESIFRDFQGHYFNTSL